MTEPKFLHRSRLVAVLWGILLLIAIVAFVIGRASLGFVALATVALAVAPAYLASTFEIRLPTPFLVAITAFLFGSVFMGEAFNFYEKYWWWDIALHGSSALGFGLIGFLLMHMLFAGDRYAAPPSAVSFFGFCFAMTVGAVWEIFEFLMDLGFGLNMQKSGLPDTMGDLIVDAVGAAIGALAGFIYLKGKDDPILTSLIREFIGKNRNLYQKSRDRFRRRPN